MQVAVISRSFMHIVDDTDFGHFDKIKDLSVEIDSYKSDRKTLCTHVHK